MSQKISIDFDVKSDLYYLKVFDFSDWALIENRPSIIEVTLPGFATPKTRYFDKNKVNIFNSITLDGSCVECDSEDVQTLSDGIYIIKVIGSPSTYNKERKYLKTDLLQMEIDKIYIDSISNPSKDLIIDKLAEIDFILKGAEAHLRYDMEKECGMLFQQAQKLVDRLNDCKTCH
jgi:hypothetical protein